MSERKAKSTAKVEKPAARADRSRLPSHAGESRALYLAGNLALQKEYRGDMGVRLHQGGAAQKVLDEFAAPGAALGQNILLSRTLAASQRERVLRHEQRHVEQVSGRDVDPQRPLRLGRRNDRWERAAMGSGAPGTGADPQALRLFSPESENSTQPYGECREGEPTGDDSADAAGSVNEPMSLTDASEPLVSMPQESLSSETEQSICQQPFANASFDPEAVDVAGMRNDTLNSESIRVDRWISDNGYVSPPHDDFAAYRRLQQRLRGERNTRVQTGFLWMTTAVDPAPDQFYMLHASSGETIIISVTPELATGVPNRSFPGPIMTRQQFDDHLSGLDIPILTEDEYIDRLRATAAEVAPELLMPPVSEIGNLATPQDRYRGYAGGQGRLDARVQGISDALPWSTSVVRQGEIGEGFALHSLRGRGATSFNNAGLFWNALNSPRVVQSGGASSYLMPRGLDLLRPIRRGWDSTPAVDIALRQPLSQGGGDFDLMSVKVSMREGTNRNTRYSYYLDELAGLGDTGRNNLRLFRDAHHSGASLENTGSRIALMIPEVHAQDVRALLRNPTGFETTDSGRQALTPNWAQNPRSGPRTPARWNMRSHFANAQFPVPIDVGDSGAPLRTGADLLGALRDGRIDQTRFDQHITELGEHLSRRVFGFDLPDNVLQHYESFRSAAQTRNARDLRAALPIEVIQIEEAHRRMGGNANAPTFANRRSAVYSTAHSNARRGAVGNVLFSAGANILFNENADLSNPRYREQLIEQMAVEGIANYGADLGETVLRSRLSYQALEEGLEATAPRLLAGRMAARALPGLADAAIEGYGMLTDNRENSATEVVVRTGRAAVIGAGAAYAGAAAGTAVGGPIGFVVGFGVGFLIGWAANKLTPGGGEYWNQRAEEQRRTRERAAAEARRREELVRRLEAERQRLVRLNRPLDETSASTVGVEGIFGLPTSNPMFMSSEEGVQPTVGELEREYILSVLLMSERGRSQEGG